MANEISILDAKRVRSEAQRRDRMRLVDLLRRAGREFADGFNFFASGINASWRLALTMFELGARSAAYGIGRAHGSVDGEPANTPLVLFVTFLLVLLCFAWWRFR